MGSVVHVDEKSMDWRRLIIIVGSRYYKLPFAKLEAAFYIPLEIALSGKKDFSISIEYLKKRFHVQVSCLACINFTTETCPTGWLRWQGYTSRKCLWLPEWVSGWRNTQRYCRQMINLAVGRVEPCTGTGSAAGLDIKQ